MNLYFMQHVFQPQNYLKMYMDVYSICDYPILSEGAWTFIHLHEAVG